MEQNAEKLVAEFFAGKVYFTFENKDELNSFSAFIKLYGPYADLQLYMPTFLKRGETKSAAWGHIPGALFSQVLAMDDFEHFKKYCGKHPIKYADVRDYVEQQTKIKESENGELIKQLNPIKDSEYKEYYCACKCESESKNILLQKSLYKG